MTIRQFLTQLKKVAKTKQFKINRDGCIRYGSLCPLEVVAGTGPGTAFGEARHKLKMSGKAAGVIIDSADYVTFTKPSARYCKALLRATGLA